MTEFEKLVHHRDSLQKHLTVIMEFSQTVLNGNLECLEYQIASGDIKTPEQLAKYGVIDQQR